MVAKNKHLSNVLEHYKVYADDDENAPLELIMDVTAELKLSRLLAPAVEEGDRFVLDRVDVDGISCLPLYTSIEEFRKHTDSGIILSFAFEEYVDIVDEEKLDGIVINFESECLTFDKEFLETLPEDAPLNVKDRGEAYSAEELKEIFETTSTDEFDKQINPADLHAKLSNEILLNLVYSEESLDDKLEDGILKAGDVGDFSLCIREIADVQLVPVFTSKDNMSKSMNDDLYYYGQITRMSNLIDYVLANDLDGFIINPDGDEKIIHRDDLLSQARGIEIIIEDSRFNDAQEYAFKI